MNYPLLFSGAICSPDVELPRVWGLGPGFCHVPSADGLPLPWPSSGPPEPPTHSARRSTVPFAVYVLFPTPAADQASMCSCSPAENFLWAWVTRGSRHEHAASGSFPPVKVGWVTHTRTLTAFSLSAPSTQPQTHGAAFVWLRLHQFFLN